MKLGLPFFEKKLPFSYFLVLVLRNEKANAVVFEELNGKIKIIGEGVEYFTDPIDEASIEQMLDVLDKAISTAETLLPQSVQTEKTIFGLKEAWVEENKIKKEYLAKLKKISEELSLTPIGFLVISQAISHFLQKEEGAPVSAILVELSQKLATVSLIRAGRIIETISSDIKENAPATVDTLLKHLESSEILPSRIIIFDGEEDLSQEFIAYRWSKTLPFLHLPQITNLPLSFDAKAVLFGAAAQMGFEVLEKEEKKEIKEEQQKEEQPEKDVSFSLDNFGFAKDVDVTKTPSLKRPKTQSIQEEPSQPKVLKMDTLSIFAKSILSFASHLIKSVGLRVKLKMSFPFSFVTGSKKIVLLIAISAIIIGFIFYYLFGTRATVVLSIKPKIVEKQENVIFSTGAPTTATNVIPVEPVSVSEEGTISTLATGKQEVGDKAKGIVTIFNSLSQAKTLAKDSVIKAPNGLQFLLEKDITIKGVATHSADETVPPSKAEVSVIAAQISKESNLPSGTKFSVSSFDITEIVAKNDNPFAGGTKKEVTVVSKNDLAKLENELAKSLESKSRDAFGKKLSKNRSLLPILATTLSNKKQDKALGQQADNVTLKATVSYEGLSYQKDDILTLASSLLKNKTPQDKTINYNKIKVDIKDIKKKNDKEFLANLNIKGLLQPKIEAITLAKKISGKSLKNAKEELLVIPQVSNVNISLSPQIPFLPKILPRIDKNINITINLNG